MLDINFIKDNKVWVAEAIKNKRLQQEVDVEELLSVYNSYQNILRLVETKRALRNKITQDITKFLDPEHAYERQKLMQEAVEVKKDLQDLEAELTQKKEDYEKLLLLVPNVFDPEVPIGKDDTENVVIKTVGDIPKFNFEPKDHVELGASLDIIDIDKAGVVSGSRFYYLKNEAVLLEFAIVQVVFKTLTDEKIIQQIAKSVKNPFYTPFTPIVPPVFIKPQVMKRMDRLDPIDDRYYFEKDDLVLVGSAEHTMGPLHMDETLNLKELPKRYIGFSTAFRRESGSYGQDVKGILRTHQFDKLEMESFAPVEHGRHEQDLFVAIQEYLLQKLELPYQVVHICTGDMGKPDFRQIDMECYIPTQKKYRETHTSDYMTDYQSRRLNTMYIDEKGNKKYVHMNDATAIAIGRILIAILENHQKADGSVRVPEALTAYTNFKEIKPKNGHS
ncbi:serine--tRNA ligase [candidate division WWE3 bacterium RBG_13_37_7]|uniref:Serine--tRNA ligase n=1 Tax=candidate division WWE3 bacterium RBG_13_37_7 TaxID=1802609 RepID=A0A1F4U0K9_UNCKA|nr:MAG: serine--tRNA ligase [candidate division WWE3 bacterium RBG_13_37_7]